MQIGVRSSDFQFNIDASSISCIDAGNVSYDMRIGNETEIRKQILSVIRKELLDILRAGLLVPFKQHDDVVA